MQKIVFLLDKIKICCIINPKLCEEEIFTSSSNKLKIKVISKKNSDNNEIVKTDSFSIFGKVLTGTLVTAGVVEAANETVVGVTLAEDKEPEKLIQGKYSNANWKN